MERKLTNSLVLFALAFSSFAFGQDLKISGIVKGENNFPLPGVNILVKGTDRGALTDFNGNYMISATQNDVLVFSYVGYTTQEIVVTTVTTLDVNLALNTSELDEIVVVGYGKSTKRNLTDNVASVSSNEINNIPVPSVQSTLSGKASGVQVTQVNGKAESGIKVRVRGVATISSSQEPLYVVDGIPIINSDENINDSPINPLISLNPDDIASIEILKDASSAAIYGARGTNGVVLITTKRGKSGNTKISLNTSYGWSKATNRMKFLNTPQYVELLTEAYLNEGYTLEDVAADLNDFSENEADWKNSAVDTNWEDLAFVNGGVQTLNLNASGGAEKTQFFLSTGYNKTDGIVRGNNLERYSFRANVDHNASEKLQIGMASSIAKTLIARLANDNQFANPLQASAQQPFIRPYLDNGMPNSNTLYYNFLNQVSNAYNETTIWRTIANLYAQYQIIPSLSFRSEVGYDLNIQTAETFDGHLTQSQSVGGYAVANSVENEKYTLNNYFNYLTSITDDIELEAIGGISFEDDRRKQQSVEGQGFPSDDLRTVDSAAEIVGGGSSRSQFTFLSYFGRANLNILNKYLFKASLRYDGSSRFGKDEQFGLFPAISGAWIMSDEDFLKDSELLSLLKIRASWGVTGNAGIGNFASRSLISGASYNGRPALQPTQLGDPSLKWETTNQYDLGLDFGIVENRISGQIDVYNKTTTDLILAEPIPSTSGYTTLTRNVGQLKNTGIEFVLDTKNFVGEMFTWSSSFNISYNKNEVTSLPGGEIVSGQNIVSEGETLASFYMVEYAGADPANGDALFVSNVLKADGTRDKTLTNNYNSAARVILGSPFPDVLVGFTNNLNYKDFDLSFTFQGQYGASIYNGAGRYQSSNGDFFDNQTIDQLNRWQKPGDITNVPQARFLGGNGTQHSSRYLQKADFIRLRNLTFGYTLPNDFSKSINIDKLRIYFTGVNLLTFTEYTGYDPESTYDVYADSNINVGTAFYSAPSSKTYTVGINLQF
ncbi:TonB-dependent receptor [Gelidibacter sp.]|uniref:SusC/RagA family TonB-linked outer membrane protein n=1 Tax=Gelidibacter sp. TaxID=2018083 RepID=UPI003267E659